MADWVVKDDAVALDGSAWGSFWIKIAVLGLLISAFYWQQFGQLVNIFRADANWSHGFIIPLFSLYLLYIRRSELLSASRRICWWGLVPILAAVLIKAWAVMIIHNAWIAQLSIPLLIFGITLYLAGPKVAIIAAVPIFYLALAMSWPDSLYQRLSLPLQNLAARMSTGLLQLFGAQVTVSASSLQITSNSGQSYPLQVAEACSGVRSLMAFIALSVAMAYIEPMPLWQRLTVIAAGVPIALVCNIIRVTTTCTMYVIDKPELGQDFMHSFTGMLLLVPALLLLFLLIRLLHSMYEDVDDNEENILLPSAPSTQNPEAGQ